MLTSLRVLSTLHLSPVLQFGRSHPQEAFHCFSSHGCYHPSSWLADMTIRSTGVPAAYYQHVQVCAEVLHLQDDDKLCNEQQVVPHVSTRRAKTEGKRLPHGLM